MERASRPSHSRRKESRFHTDQLPGSVSGWRRWRSTSLVLVLRCVGAGNLVGAWPGRHQFLKCWSSRRSDRSRRVLECAFQSLSLSLSLLFSLFLPPSFCVTGSLCGSGCGRPGRRAPHRPQHECHAARVGQQKHRMAPDLSRQVKDAAEFLSALISRRSSCAHQTAPRHFSSPATLGKTTGLVNRTWPMAVGNARSRKRPIFDRERRKKTASY